MEERKRQEEEFHNVLRDEGFKTNKELYRQYISNKKLYSVTRQSSAFVSRWLEKKVNGKNVLDYCCGNGDMVVKMAKLGASEVTGIDISNVSIKNARELAEKENLSGQTHLFVMDAEHVSFSDNSFDVIYEGGVLHHLYLDNAYSELARILKQDGEIICVEALKHNPVIQYYRKKTPHLRTEWETEHILGKDDIMMAGKYFSKIEIIGFFHLAAIAAVPFRSSPGFKIILSILEYIDDIILKLPIIKWQAWQVIFVLSQPKK